MIQIHDKDYFLVSDGTCNLHLWDPETLEEVDRKCITVDNEPAQYLNDLQVVKGKIYANVWLDDRIAVIDWEKGVVEKWIDLFYLRRLRKIPDTKFAQNNAVLNGIAYNAEKDVLYVTGKSWNRLFQIRLLSTVSSTNTIRAVFACVQNNKKNETATN